MITSINQFSIRFLALPFLFLTFFFFPFCLQAEGRVRIGVSVGLTGNLSSIGVGVRNAILLSQKENDPDHKVEFLFEDDGFDPKRTVTSVMKFINQDKVSGIIVLGSGTALAVNDIVERNRVPMIFLGNSKKAIIGKKYSIMHFLDTKTENDVVVKKVKELPYKRIAVVCSSHEGMLDLGKSFSAALPDHVAMNLEVPPGDTDFRSIITRINAANIDAVYNVLLPGGASLFARQLRQYGYKGELFSAHSVDDLNEIKNAQGALTGTWFVTGNVIGDGDFVRRFQEMFHEPPGVAAPNGYDAAKLFIKAAHAPDINTYLHQVKDFPGIMGTYSISPDGYFQLPASLRTITATGIEPFL